MGNYNAQYETYYSSMINKKHKSSSAQHNVKRIITNRIIQELIGGTILFSFIFVCHIYKDPYVKKAYDYAKNEVNYNFNYEKAIEKMKNISSGDIQGEVNDFVKGIKLDIMGGDSLKDKVKKNFIMPFKDSGVQIKSGSDGGFSATSSKSIDIVASFDGTIKEIGDAEKGDKYVLVDNGDGLETKYSGLIELNCKKGGKIKKGELVGITGTNTFQFNLLYMGENLNTNDYMNKNR